MERTSSPNWFWQEWIFYVTCSCCFRHSAVRWRPCSWIRVAQFSGRPKRENSGELWREGLWTFLFKLARTSSFGPVRTNQWEATWDKSQKNTMRSLIGRKDFSSVKLSFCCCWKGKIRICSVKASFRPDIVRWTAVISQIIQGCHKAG